MAITILIADDQPLMRSALRTCLAAEADFEVVAEAEDGRQAVEMARRLRPDVVVTDVRMPELDGVGVTQQLMSDPQPFKVLVLTTFELDEYIVEALRAGACGFLLKDARPQELVHAVRVVAAGEAILSPVVTRRLLDRYAERLPSFEPPTTPAAGSGTLTTRELVVLRLVAKGLSNAEIGTELHLANSSVKTHVSHILAKLGLSQRVQLVVLAYETGLVQPNTL
jgi:DNA-binding NarL/FixJ family response regulator